MRFHPAPLAAAIFLAAATLTSARTLIYCGTLIDGRADAPKKEMTVVVNGDRIAAIRSRCGASEQYSRLQSL
jgi:hypothetical protein